MTKAKTGVTRTRSRELLKDHVHAVVQDGRKPIDREQLRQEITAAAKASYEKIGKPSKLWSICLEIVMGPDGKLELLSPGLNKVPHCKALVPLLPDLVALVKNKKGRYTLTVSSSGTVMLDAGRSLRLAK